MTLMEFATGPDLTASGDRYCLRGCERQHWAVCVNLSPNELAKRATAEDAGERYTPPCRGCAPSVCRVGSLICDQCFGRARGLLEAAPELLQRLRSMTDDERSRWNWDRVVVSGSPVGGAATARDDITDAMHAIETALRYFRAGLATLTRDTEAMGWLGPLVLDEHPAIDGIRERWSIRDAMSRWGLENRHRFIHPDARPNAPHGAYAAYDDEEVVGPVREWFDPLLTVEQAAQRREVSTRSIRMWAQKGYITAVATSKTIRGNVLTYFHASDIDAATPAPPGKSRGATLDADRARQLHSEGLSGAKIAEQLGVSPTAVSRWGRAEGLTFGTRRPPTKLDTARARELYDAGNADPAIAHLLGVSAAAVGIWRRGEGLPSSRGCRSFDADRARELYAAGWSTRAMAAELGITASTVSKWAKAEGIAPKG